MSLSEIFFCLIVGHMIADYPLQGDFLARGKNRQNPIPGVPWQHPLAAHCFIHAGFVFLFTGSLLISLAELVAHALIDDAKCAGKISYDTDQALHIACKALWVAIIAGVAL